MASSPALPSQTASPSVAATPSGPSGSEIAASVPSVTATSSSAISQSASASPSMLLSPAASLPNAPSTSSSRRPSSSGGYVSRVSFDALGAASGSGSGYGGGGTGLEHSYTLRATTSAFRRTRESCTFLVATDLNEYSMHALNWAIDKLIEDGDELVVLRVLDPSSSSVSLSKASVIELAKEEATSLLRTVTERNSYSSASSATPNTSTPPSSTQTSNNNADEAELQPINEISITIEHVTGKVHESIQKLVAVYRPDSLIVGTRGRSDSLIKSAFIGSVSRYCVANSKVPVIVIRPAIKVRKSLDKRGQRQTYLDMVEGPSRPGSSAGPGAKGSTGLGLPKSKTMDSPSNSRPSSRNNSPTRPKSSSGNPFAKIPLSKTKTLS